MSRWHMALCADCKLRIHSSIVIHIASRLPLHPGLKGLQVDQIALTHPRLRFD
ncbi:hypothetical protein SCLCIDRAFT_20288 [Scleroderma citrinum Foug A]|uniref:Uncharacterized protein n=1 Tax=Scleroderma citrinum Foug A TaxID=1036808 RepID=A0A0C3EKB9_9AGAM|nr:hypothetical protein SCLCIDRAFT_20288 [Scleroderma citrinum Foug A]